MSNPLWNFSEIIDGPQYNFSVTSHTHAVLEMCVI